MIFSIQVCKTPVAKTESTKSQTVEQDRLNSDKTLKSYITPKNDENILGDISPK